ncbi:MAG: sulfatase-like hydrolase/transferase [Planctomycetaceae bacterium]|nr:sulfatase-like hydrolase/transferase [Planctomycetales bacterium]MCB9874759.1 sulfatase-like hydrolase/transferase [Planctomycetaceae bacterium]MCB9939041.1 sulfatase-like hydrolase/transferase [Planctomycetaceae bacterium]
MKCEGDARVPLIVYWPGVTQPGTQCDSLVQSTDLFPTLVEVAGGDSSAHSDLDGVSLMPAICGKPLPDRGMPLFGYRAYEDLYASVRDGHWKMLAYRSGKVSLYNIDQEEAEQNDVSDSNPAIVKRLTGELVAWEQRMNVKKYSGVQQSVRT